jgi:hypothetical protein
VRIPEALAAQIKEVSVQHGYTVAHPQHGLDLRIKFDRTQSPDRMYELRVSKDTMLTEEELAYLRYPLRVVRPETVEQATDEWRRLKPLFERANRLSKSLSLSKSYMIVSR